MTADTAVASELEIYVCPVCKGFLRQEEGVLRCGTQRQRQNIPGGVLCVSKSLPFAFPLKRRMRRSCKGSTSWYSSTKNQRNRERNDRMFRASAD